MAAAKYCAIKNNSEPPWHTNPYVRSMMIRVCPITTRCVRHTEVQRIPIADRRSNTRISRILGTRWSWMVEIRANRHKARTHYYFLIDNYMRWMRLWDARPHFAQGAFVLAVAFRSIYTKRAHLWLNVHPLIVMDVYMGSGIYVEMSVHVSRKKFRLQSGAVLMGKHHSGTSAKVIRV